MDKSKVQTLKGFRDFLPAQMAIRNRVKKIFTDVFESFGFEPLSTPSLEYADVLLGKYGQEADKLVYTFEDRGGRKIGLPYDLTVPTARVAAQYNNQLSMPFKRYQIQRVWRAENTQKGRYREIKQCDVDILGSSSPLADAEILAIIFKAISRLTLGEFKILINSRPMLFGIMEKAGIPSEKFKDTAISIDKLDKLSPDEVKLELTQKRGLTKAQTDKLFEITNRLQDTYQTGLDLVEKTEKVEDLPIEPFDKLVEIAKLAIEMGVDPQILTPRFSLSRGLDYYTGTIFETVMESPKIGSITGGGRYDNLIKTLGGPDCPAVGTTLGLDRICDVIEELNLWSDIPVSPSQILVTIFSKDLLQETLAYTKMLRESGLNAENYLEADANLEKQLKYADKKQIPWAIIIGPEELSKKQVVLKNLKTKTQESIPAEDVAAKLR